MHVFININKSGAHTVCKWVGANSIIGRLWKDDSERTYCT
jgi:hypothetical protein